jgi:hypothetical protein
MTAAEQPRTYPLSEEGVSAALNALPPLSEDIAIRLDELGIKGQRGQDCACPVVNYLARVLPDAEEITVGHGTAFIKGVVRQDIDGFYDSWDVRLHVAFGGGITDFVEDFDGGLYPDLIEEDSNADAAA